MMHCSSAALTWGCCEGSSRTHQCQAAAHARPTRPNRKKMIRHDMCKRELITEISIGVMPAVTSAPTQTIPWAVPRSR